jgi:hypothetical protein
MKLNTIESKDLKDSIIYTEVEKMAWLYGRAKGMGGLLRQVICNMPAGKRGKGGRTDDGWLDFIKWQKKVDGTELRSRIIHDPRPNCAHLS